MPLLCRPVQVYTLGRLSLDDISSRESIASSFVGSIQSGVELEFRIRKAKNLWIPESLTWGDSAWKQNMTLMEDMARYARDGYKREEANLG